MRTITLSLLALSLAYAVACSDSSPGEGGSGGTIPGGSGGSVTGGSGGTASGGSGGDPGGSGGTVTGGSGGDPGGSGGTVTGGSGGDPGGSGGGGSGGSGGSTPETGLDCSAPVGEIPALKLTPVAEGLARPVLAVSPPGDTSRLFILEQHDGRIRIVKDGTLLETPFLDVGSLLRKGNEEGLLGLAFHPDYAKNGRFFIHYSAAGDGASTIMEYAVSATDPDLADPVPVQLVLQHPTAQSNHNGGMIAFGEDGLLYIAIGDGGSQDDPECDAQNAENLLGKISRVDVDATPAADGYPAAAGNPGGKKFFHVGFRNPWRFSFDPCTDDLYVGDVGQVKWEEISVVAAGSPPANFGWPYREGAHDHGESCPGDQPAGLIEPVAEYSHSEGCSITGGFVYRGRAIPGLRGAYLYGDYCSHLVRAFRWDGSSAQSALDLTDDLGVPGANGLSSFGQDAAGEIYVCDFTGGAVYRIDAE